MCNCIREYAVKITVRARYFIYKYSYMIFPFFIIIIYTYFNYNFPRLVDRNWILLSIALLTAILAIHKYYSEQRINRLQKIYFEDTFLGQAKSLEEIISQTKKNLYLTENILNIATNIISQNNLILSLKKDALYEQFTNVINQLDSCVKTTEFKKETITTLFLKSNIKSSIPSWIEKMERDSYNFDSFLKSQLLLIRFQILNITEENIHEFDQKLITNIFDYIQENYVLIERHRIFFILYAEIVLELASEHYSSVKMLQLTLKKYPISMRITILNEAYKSVISDFNGVDFNGIDKQNVINIKSNINSVLDKMKKDLYGI